MRRRRGEVAVLVGMVACGRAAAGVPPSGPADAERLPTPSAAPLPPVRPGADLTFSSKGAAPATGERAPPPASPGPAAAPRAARPTTIALSGGKHEPGDDELAAGDDAFEHGDLSGAQKHYEAARAAAPRSVAPSVGLARVRIAGVGIALDYAAAKGNREVAAVAQDLSRAAKAARTFGPAYVELGRALLLLGDAPAAIDALRRAVQLLPDEPEARSQLGIALLATGHAPEAVTELARAKDADPDSAARHGNLGTALILSGRTKEAIVEYEARARLDDGDARAHSDLGTALLGTQDLERATSELQRAVQLDPQHASYHSNLGFAMQQAGHVDVAVREYREALRLDPKLVSAWINLATALAADPKTRREARAALDKAGALSPDDPRVKANLEELDALEKQHPGRTVP